MPNPSRSRTVSYGQHRRTRTPLAGQLRIKSKGVRRSDAAAQLRDDPSELRAACHAAETCQDLVVSLSADAAAKFRVFDQSLAVRVPVVRAGRKKAGFAVLDRTTVWTGRRRDRRHVNECRFEKLQLALRFTERIAELQRRQVDVESCDFFRQFAQWSERPPFDLVGECEERRKLFDVDERTRTIRASIQHKATVRILLEAAARSPR